MQIMIYWVNKDFIFVTNTPYHSLDLVILYLCLLHRGMFVNQESNKINQECKKSDQIKVNMQRNVAYPATLDIKVR